MRRLALFLSSAGFIGYIPFAPGTAGSLVGVGLYAGFVRLGATPVLQLAVIAVLLAAGVWSATVAEAHFGLPDPGSVVIDEVVGMLVTLIFTQAGWSAAVAGFVLFRLFDIIKPFPTGRLERLRGGWGIMADDVMAGVYANVGLQVLLRAAPGWVA